MLDAAGTNNLQKMLTTAKGLKAVTRWILTKGLLKQFALAKEQLLEKQSEESVQ